MNWFIASIVAIAICGIAVAAIFRRYDVSTGHAIILGVGSAIFALPLISSFEWTNDGIKLVSKKITSNVAEVVEQVEAINTRQASLMKNVQNVNLRLVVISEQISTIETALNEDITTSNTSQLQPPDDIKDLKEANEQLSKAIQDSIEANACLVSLGEAINAIGQQGEVATLPYEGGGKSCPVVQSGKVFPVD